MFVLPKPPVLVAFEYPSAHGGERSLLATLPVLRESFELSALAPPTGELPDLLRAAGVPLLAGNVREPADVLAAVRDAAPALLHANSLSAGRAVGRVAGRLPCPATAHLRDILNLSAAAMRDLSRCRRTVAVSAAVRDHHVARGLPADRCAVVRNGIDPAAFLPDQDRAACRRSVREELELPQETPLVLCVGQIGLRKGWDVLAEAAGLLTADPPPAFLCVGERWSRKDESVRFEADAFALLNANAPGRVRRLGTRPDVARLMLASDVLAHPARQEPFGRVLLEAATAGLPIAASPVGGTPEMLGEAYAPLPPGDAAALAAALSRLLADPAERSRLADAARSRVARFTPEAAAAGLAAVWREVLAGA